MVSRWPTIVSSARPRCALSAVADFGEKTLEKRTINDLILLGKKPHEDRVIQLHETMKVGLAKCAMKLSEMPFGFCNAPSIKRVASAYVQNFRQVMEYEHQRGVRGLVHQDYHELTRNIFNQHRGTMLDVAKGVFEFNEDLSACFGEGLELAEIREEFGLIRDIEQHLDEFFTNRLTLRILISHVHTLNSAKAGSSDGQEMVGVVNVKTQPIQILSRAYVAARFMCIRDFKTAPELRVNDVPYEEYIAQSGANRQHFAYVHTHLFYIFLELLKNAARASIEHALTQEGHNASSGGDYPKDLQIPSMRVIVPEDQELWEQERSIKLADSGIGMNRSILSKAFCYFYSSVKARPTVAAEVSDFDRRVPLAGFGFGLPISRVTARYFSGDIDLNSIPGRGTDVYVYL